ncbi:MAG: hypothetical protein NTY55_02375 [Flavobacteriia bacterium]|nr:hypothetical protein [Flavobacteriia bacterium]
MARPITKDQAGRTVQRFFRDQTWNSHKITENLVNGSLIISEIRSLFFEGFGFTIFDGKNNFCDSEIDFIEYYLKKKGIENQGFAVQNLFGYIPFNNETELYNVIKSVIDQMNDFEKDVTFSDMDKVTSMDCIFHALLVNEEIKIETIRHDVLNNCLILDLNKKPANKIRIKIWACPKPGAPTRVSSDSGTFFFDNFGELKDAFRRATNKALITTDEDKEEGNKSSLKAVCCECEGKLDASLTEASTNSSSSSTTTSIKDASS